jgi:hypothetical protein
VAPQDEVLVARLEVPPRDVPRVDLARELILAVPIDVVRARPAHVQVLRLLAVRPESERPLGEYTVPPHAVAGPGRPVRA